MKYLPYLIITALIAWYLFHEKPAIPDNQNHKIDSLNVVIHNLEKQVEYQKARKDSIQVIIKVVQGKRDTVTREIERMPADLLVHLWDETTTGTHATEITEIGIVTEHTRIRDGLIGITENESRKEEIRLKDLIIESQEASVSTLQHIILAEREKYALKEQENTELRKQLRRQKRLNRLTQIGAGVMIITAIIL
jgi:hypothetical protein